MLYVDDNLDLFMDLYELTMTQGFFRRGQDQQAVFDAFIRKAPYDQNESYVVFAGLAPLLAALENFRFSADSLTYLKSLNLFEADFLDYLSDFRFQGSFYGVREGDLIFPNEPFLRAEGTLIELQLVEGLVLNVLNFQSLIATKASRIVWGAGARNLLEFGLRRAQGTDGALSGTRAAMIGGAIATSNTLAGKLFNLPVKGTMAHSWIMSFDSEREAFETYAKLYPNSCVLLIDTYNTLESGIENALPVLQSLQESGHTGFGVRIDSGDLGYLSQVVRARLDAAGLTEATIAVSNDLDETIIAHLIASKAPIDLWGVGTKLITGGEFSALSGVFKLAAFRASAASPWQDKMKLTDNIAKTSQPGIKNTLRFFNAHGKMVGDLICLESERTDLLEKAERQEAFTAYHPFNAQKPWQIQGYERAKVLLNPVMQTGRAVTPVFSIQAIQENTQASFSMLEPRYYRLLNPHLYKVGLSEALFHRKEEALNEYQLHYPS